ncbi:hypothetical protein [Oculatella sp. FACHB-28]|uniref:hypothetical protein n=1 Tax=Oculatella sp. FACHB-28 TaxID=2692845 RepID=UPI001F554851|nr:hypothetical protein [Oculatella sp. FACHB-28]
MLQLGSKTMTIEGVTVFADHADPQQYWFLPNPVDLARRGTDEEPQFTLITYRPAVANSGISGGGFLTLEVELKLKKELEQKILSKLASVTRGRPRLAAVPFDEGTVQVMALDLQGGGGTNAEPAPPGAFRAVEKILGTTKPALDDTNNAVFGLTLSQEGAIILRQAFQEGGKPVGVIYDLKYTALRPALEVEITANYKRIYDHLSFGVDFSAGGPIAGVPVYLQAGVDMAFEKLKQEGIIQIKVINFSDAQDQTNKEQWALDFFKETLLNEWFKPTLAPITFDNNNSGGIPGLPGIPGTGNGQGGTPSPGNGTAGGNTGGRNPQGNGTEGNAGGRNSGSSSTSGSGSAPGGTSGGSERTATTGVRRTAIALRDRAETASATDEVQPYQLSITSVTPNRSGYTVTHTPVADSTQVTLTFAGGSQPPVVKIGDAVQTLNAARQRTLDVPPGANLAIEADYPPVQHEEAFYLFFDYDKPLQPGWSVNPPSTTYRRYLNNATTPLDSRFQASTGNILSIGGGAKGAAALRNWIQNSLATPRQVRIDAYASYEGNNTPQMRQRNQDLSDRRRQVAEGIILDTPNPPAILSNAAHGHTEAFTAGRNGDPTDRVAIVRGMVQGDEAIALQATLSRPTNQPGEPPGEELPGEELPGEELPGGELPGGELPGGEPPSGEPPNDEQPNEEQPDGQPPLGIRLAFSLKKIEQIEDKVITLRYNRTDAVQRTYAPQGLIGLLARDLVGTGHFIDVDLDHPFFRQIDVTVDAPVDLERLGLTAIDVALDYGSAEDPATLRHKDFTFDRNSPREQSYSFFMNRALDLGYHYQVQYHFDPLSGWDGNAFSYEFASRPTQDRTLLINPFNDFGFLEIKVLPGDIDAGMVDSIDVHFNYEDPGNWSRNKVITVKPDSEEQFWRLRLNRPEQRTYSYRLVHHLKDGSVREGIPTTTQATTLVVNDPFEDSLNLEFLPNYDASAIRMLIIDVKYEDPQNHYTREERLRFEGQSLEPQQLRIARINPQRKTYTFQLTVLGTDHSVRREQPVTTDAAVVFVGEHLQPV